MIKNINNKGSSRVLVILFISTFILLLIGIVFIYRDKFSKFPNSKSESIKKIENLDKELFELFTLENLVSEDKDKVKSNIKKIRENEIEFRKIYNSINNTWDSYCAANRSVDIYLRDIEVDFITTGGNYKDEFIRLFPVKRNNLLRDYQLWCRNSYESIGIKLYQE